jgi:hypothetical protein
MSARSRSQMSGSQRSGPVNVPQVTAVTTIKVSAYNTTPVCSTPVAQILRAWARSIVWQMVQQFLQMETQQHGNHVSCRWRASCLVQQGSSSSWLQLVLCSRPHQKRWACATAAAPAAARLTAHVCLTCASSQLYGAAHGSTLRSKRQETVGGWIATLRFNSCFLT